MLRTVQAIVRTALTPFTRNKNTGNKYEAAAILHIGRQMGLTDRDLDEMAPFFTEIRANVPLPEPKDFLGAVGGGYSLEGKPVIDIRSTTQDDGDGKTGDIMLVLEGGQERSVSVTEGTAPKGVIKKCLSNPSCTRYGCGAEEISRIGEIRDQGIVDYKAEMVRRFGHEDAWVPRTRTVAACRAAAAAAELTCAKFHTLSKEQQVGCVKKIMQISDGTAPADYLLLVNKRLDKTKMFKFGAMKIDTNSVVLRNSGVYIEFSVGDKVIGQTQVKPNNGLWKKHKDGVWRTSSLHASWDAVFTLNEVFDMQPVA